jgi:hypothetical protein
MHGRKKEELTKEKKELQEKKIKKYNLFKEKGYYIYNI